MSIHLNIAYVLLIAAVFSILTACSRTEKPKTYEDCLLLKTPTAKTVDALALVKDACKGKFPKLFDFDAIATSAAVSSWREVALKPDFSRLPEKEKAEARRQYFESVVMPRVDPTYLEDARTQFDAFSRYGERAAVASSVAASTAAKP
jgi:hypothetical protein